ncbi:hypothetical protein D3C72_859370 [compost metagenome]
MASSLRGNSSKSPPLRHLSVALPRAPVRTTAPSNRRSPPLASRNAAAVPGVQVTGPETEMIVATGAGSGDCAAAGGGASRAAAMVKAIAPWGKASFIRARPPG